LFKHSTTKTMRQPHRAWDHLLRPASAWWRRVGGVWWFPTLQPGKWPRPARWPPSTQPLPAC